MSVLTDLIFAGSNAVAGLTENAVNEAIAKYGEAARGIHIVSTCTHHIVAEILLHGHRRKEDERVEGVLQCGYDFFSQAHSGRIYSIAKLAIVY